MANTKSVTFTAPKMMRVDGTAHLFNQKCIVAAASLADTFDFVLPGGTNVAEMAFVVDDIDSGTALVWKAGYTPLDSASALTPVDNYWGSGITTGQAAGRYQSTAKPITFEEDVIVRVTVTTAAAGVNTGTLELWMIAGANMVGAK
jgi:hypothetical protein